MKNAAALRVVLALLLAALASAFVAKPLAAAAPRAGSALRMNTIADGVQFDTVAREWRCKWSGDADKASLVAAQKAFDEVKATVKAVPGVKSVQRVVCGGCLDFKIITALEADKFGDWEAKNFEPETSFLKALGGIDGVSQIETQTFTLMPL